MPAVTVDSTTEPITVEVESAPVTVVSGAADLAITAHLADTSDAHDASAISFSPTGALAATDVQAAIAEAATDAATALASHEADTTSVHGITDTSALALTTGVVTPTGGGKETIATASVSGAVTIDLANGNVHVLTLTGNVTSITVSGATNSKACSFEVHWVQDGTGGRTIAYPAAWKWSGGTDHVMSSAAGARDRIVAETLDNGTTVYADVVGQAYA